MTLTTAQPTARQTTPAGQRVEQARYRIPAGQRALYAQRIDGRVALVDAPVDHHAPVLLVERHVESLAELRGLVAAYIEHSLMAGQPAELASRQRVAQLAEEV